MFDYSLLVSLLSRPKELARFDYPLQEQKPGREAQEEEHGWSMAQLRVREKERDLQADVWMPADWDALLAAHLLEVEQVDAMALVDSVWDLLSRPVLVASWYLHSRVEVAATILGCGKGWEVLVIVDVQLAVEIADAASLLVQGQGASGSGGDRVGEGIVAPRDWVGIGTSGNRHEGHCAKVVEGARMVVLGASHKTPHRTHLFRCSSRSLGLVLAVHHPRSRSLAATNPPQGSSVREKGPRYTSGCSCCS